MARFYVGQPVVCVWGPEMFQDMTRDFARYREIAKMPVKGHKYHVDLNCPNAIGTFDIVMVREIDTTNCFGGPYGWNENAFAPITKDEVDTMIKLAKRVGATRKMETETCD